MLTLVGTFPQRARCRCRCSCRRAWLCLQLPAQGQKTHGQHRRQYRATTECQQCQQHHRRQQPIAFVLPLPGLPGPLQCAAFAGIQHVQCLQVAIIAGDALVTPAACGGDGTQAGFIQRSLCDLALTIAIGGAGRRAQAQHRHLQAEAARLRCRKHRFAVGLVADQENLAAQGTGLPQQPHRPVDATISALAITRHHLRRQRIQVQRHVCSVVGQRRHGIGIFGIHHQTHLPALTGAQQRTDFCPRLQQPRGWQVGRGDATGQILHHHQRRAGLIDRLRLLSPAGASHRQCRQGPAQQQRPWQARASLSLASQQVRQQVGIDHLPPRVAAPLPVHSHRHDQRQCRQHPQPLRAQEMQRAPLERAPLERAPVGHLQEGGAHRRRSGHTHANAPSSNATASGHA
ncbi:hypothetical protein D3C71_845250 [compost metagenome]